MLIDIVNSHNSIVALLIYKNRGGAIFNLKFAKIDRAGKETRLFETRFNSRSIFFASKNRVLQLTSTILVRLSIYQKNPPTVLNS